MASGNSLSNYLRSAFLNWIRDNATFPARVSTQYLALFSTSPVDGGGSGVELTGSNYARVAVTANVFWGTVTAPGGGGEQITNILTATFPAASADWLTAVAFGSYDAATVGNQLFWAPLTTPITVKNGQAKGFDISDLVLSAN